MNRIQQISQDLLSNKLKLQMGIDPRVDISYVRLQAMWKQLQRERKLEQARDEANTTVHDRAA